MAAAPRPRRSVLYMPGSNARALEKGRSLPADGLILDLEDAVAPDAKDTARDQIVSALAEGGYGKREIQIRTNGLNTPWGYADIVAASKTSADAILLPKVESADTVRQVANIMIRGMGTVQIFRQIGRPHDKPAQPRVRPGNFLGIKHRKRRFHHAPDGHAGMGPLGLHDIGDLTDRIGTFDLGQQDRIGRRL